MEFGTLARSKTTINASAIGRERTTGAATGGDVARSIPPRGSDPLAPAVLTRSQTALATSRPGQAGLPTRALTVRKPNSGDSSPAATSPKPSEQTLCVISCTLTYPICPFLQKDLPGQRNFLRISWIRMLSRLLHPGFHQLTTASQIGHGTILEVLHYPAHRVHSAARAALARSNDELHGARSQRAHTTMTRKATARASGTRCTNSRRFG
jgi:hypothetical protein